jgi:glycosyltransferase involved in cell wall biosynthesis
MKRVYLNRSEIRKPWGGGAHFVNAMYDFQNKYDLTLEKPAFDLSPDVVYIAGLDREDDHFSAEQIITYKEMVSTKKKVKVIFRVNENDARKGTHNVDERVKVVAEHSDVVVFVSKWLKDYYVDKGIKCKNSCVIINGVDKEIFQPRPKIKNGKINIVAHHWSNNRLKGFDIYEQLDEFVGKNSEKYTFTYIGRHNFSFKNTKVVSPLFAKTLGDELATYNAYISASRFDPGPNHILEALSCNIPTYVHKDGGGCVEFAGPDYTFSSLDEFLYKLENQNLKMNDTSVLSTWEECVEKYYDLI